MKPQVVHFCQDTVHSTLCLDGLDFVQETLYPLLTNAGYLIFALL